MPFLALLLALAAACLWLLGHLAVTLFAAAEARTAADAAALAGAAGGRAAAEELAARNGGALVRFVVIGTDTEVTVRVDGVEATARATRELVRGP